MRGYRGHNLLEVIVATGIFILVAVSLAGVWVMYGRALAKSGEVLAANAVARSLAEGLSANGWEWLKDQEGETFPISMPSVKVERVVRGRTADITFDVSYQLKFNRDTDPFIRPTTQTNSAGEPFRFPTDICKIDVFVRWNSSGGGRSAEADTNAETTYSALAYRFGI